MEALRSKTYRTLSYEPISKFIYRVVNIQIVLHSRNPLVFSSNSCKFISGAGIDF